MKHPDVRPTSGSRHTKLSNPEVFLLANIRQQLDSGLSSLPQFMAEFYLQHHAKHHEKTLQQALKMRAYQLHDWVSEHFNHALYFEKPQGGFHLYATLKDPKAQRKVEEKFAKLSAKATKSSYFGGDDSAFRLSFANFPISENPKN